MPFVPRLLQEYRECEQALVDAEAMLDTESPNYSLSNMLLSQLEKTLSADIDAMRMLRLHREYGTRVSSVLEKIRKLRSGREHFDMPSRAPQWHEPVVRKAAAAVTAGYTEKILPEYISSKLPGDNLISQINGELFGVGVAYGSLKEKFFKKKEMSYKTDLENIIIKYSK